MSGKTELPILDKPAFTMDSNGNFLISEKYKQIFIACDRLFVHVNGRYVIFDNVPPELLKELKKTIWVRK